MDLAYKTPPHAHPHKERRPMTTERGPRRKFEYGGFLEMDQSGEVMRWRHDMGGARDVWVERGKDGGGRHFVARSPTLCTFMCRLTLTEIEKSHLCPSHCTNKPLVVDILFYCLFYSLPMHWSVQYLCRSHLNTYFWTPLRCYYLSLICIIDCIMGCLQIAVSHRLIYWRGQRPILCFHPLPIVAPAL